MRNSDEGKRTARGPRVVIDGVVVEGERAQSAARSQHRGALFLFLLAMIFAGVLILASGFFASCASSAAIKADGSLGLELKAEVPPSLGAKLRALSGKEAGARLFDPATIRRSIEARPELRLAELSSAGPDSFSASLSVLDLAAALGKSELGKKGLVRLSKGPGWTELSLRLARGQGRAMLELFPGIDEELVDALSPPALEEDPLSEAEYRTMLTSLLGSKAMAGLEASSLALDLQAPAQVLDSEGGKLSGGVLKVRVPILDLLCLEKPVTIRLRWRS